MGVSLGTSHHLVKEVTDHPQVVSVKHRSRTAPVVAWSLGGTECVAGGSASRQSSAMIMDVCLSSASLSMCPSPVL